MEKTNDSPVVRSEAGRDLKKDGNRRGVGFKVNMKAADIRRLLECPVCFEVVLSPITVCEGGHVLCKSCKEALETCPVCRGEFTQIPNLCAERFLEICLVDCRYSDSGCRKVLPGKEISEHVQVCNYRPLMCTGCDQAISYHEFLKHLLIEEDLEALNVTECITGFTIDENDLNQRSEGEPVPAWEPIWLHSYDQDFFCFLQTLNNHWWLWVGVFGLEVEECKKYGYSVTIWNRETQNMKKYVGPVHSIRASPQDLHESGQCLSLQNEQVKNFMFKGGIDIHIQIYME